MSLPQVALYFIGCSSALAETEKSIELTDTNDDSLVEFLRFMYTDDCNLTRDNVAFVLYLTHKYNVPSLAEKCIEFLKPISRQKMCLMFCNKHIISMRKSLKRNAGI